MAGKIQIIRRPTYRFYGIARAAKLLGVSVTAVHNAITGKVPNALSQAKLKKIVIIDK